MVSLVLVLLLGAEPRWEPAGSADGVHWYTRARPGVEVNELKVTVLLDATPAEVWAVLSDYAGWVESMPSTASAEVVARDGEGRSLVYLRYELPVIAARDTLIETREERTDAAWTLSWKAAAEARDVERPGAPGVVRLRVNEGEWRLEPREAGKKTFVVYRLLSAPGGDVPPFFVNRVNTLGVPKTIASLQRAIKAVRAR
jgi:hypothetical protein